MVFPTFFKSELGNKETMIWATVSSWSCFCSLYRVGYKKYNQSYFGNDHLVISIYSLFLCCWNRLFATTSVFSWQNSISLCPASFCTPRPNLPITPGVSWLPTFAFQWKGYLFWMLVSKDPVGLLRTIQLQLLQHYWLGHRLRSRWYWMVCLGNEQSSFCRFWDCIQVLHFGHFCLRNRPFP